MKIPTQPPAWTIESEYPSLQSQEFLADEARVAKICQELKTRVERLRPQLANPRDPAIVDSLQQVLLLDRENMILSFNLLTYINCIESNDARDEEAKSKRSKLQSQRSHYNQVFKPVQLFLQTCDDTVFEKIFSHPELQGGLFQWQEERKLKDTLLSEKEETLLAALRTDGFQAWSDLYFSLSGTMRVQVELNGKTEEIGLAQASGLIRSPNEQERKAAWYGIQKAWMQNEESAAAILNSLAGWRLEIYQRRSHTLPMDFMTIPLHESRIERQTLDAMMTAVSTNKSEIQQAARLMARMHGKSRLDPWDLLAPAPLKSNAGKKDFAEGFSLVQTAFAGVDPEFGQFANMMLENQWIEGRVLPNKTHGAYCTGFLKSRTPRVFQTYLGSNNDISTLAHEMGHAYHSWCLRDRPVEEDYPMTLAETASIFAETVLSDVMIQKATSKEQKLEFAWSNVETAVNLLLNIPARFDFEYSFYQKRKDCILSARELSELTDEAWTRWYGDTLSENDKMFWASKLHFSMAGVSFYNFPYTFGYLFALSIYARRKELGENFWPKYKEILKDTARMSVEDLIQKHLNEDIRKPEFWQKAIDVVKSKIQEFNSLAK